MHKNTRSLSSRRSRPVWKGIIGTKEDDRGTGVLVLFLIIIMEDDNASHQASSVSSQTWPPSLGESFQESMWIMAALEEGYPRIFTTNSGSFIEELRPSLPESYRLKHQQRPITPDTGESDDDDEEEEEEFQEEGTEPTVDGNAAVVANVVEEEDQKPCVCYPSDYARFSFVFAITLIVMLFTDDVFLWSRGKLPSVPLDNPTNLNVVQGASRPPYDDIVTYGYQVQTARDRIVLTTDRIDGLVEVWRLVADQWLLEQRWSPANATQILDLSCDKLCLRLAVAAKTVQGSSFAAVYQQQGVEWNVVGQVLDVEAQTVDLSQNGQVLAVGAPGVSSSRFNHSGRVQVYEYPTNVFASSMWQPRGSPIVGRAHYERIGERLALAGNSIVISRFMWSGTKAGRLQVYDWTNDTSWTTASEPIYVAMPRKGTKVMALSPDGTHLAVSQAIRGTRLEGLVEMYVRQGQAFTKVWEAVGTNPWHQFGAAVAVNDNYTLAVGTFPIRGSSGSVYVHDKHNDTFWVPRRFPVASVGVCAMDFSEERLVASSGKCAIGVGNEKGWVGVFENPTNITEN